MGIEFQKQALKPGGDWAGNRLTPAETAPRNILYGTTGVSWGVSGAIRFSYFTPQATTAVTKAITITGSTAAAATPTLCRIGLWSVAANGDLTLVASTANDTSLWSSTFTEYATNLSATYTLIGGQRYATGGLVVSATTVPNIMGFSSISGAATTFARDPRVAGTITGQSDLPASITAGSIANVNTFHWVGFTA